VSKGVFGNDFVCGPSLTLRVSGCCARVSLKAGSNIMRPTNIRILQLSVAALISVCCGTSAAESLRLQLTITSPLSYANTPMDPAIDFPEFIRTAAADGVLDPNSIEVRNTATNATIPRAVTEDFAYGDKGRVEFIVGNPDHREFEIRFRTNARRSHLQPQVFTPQIGVGDLLRYNASQPRPICLPYSAGLHDLNGDNRLDLTGTWNYAYRPGWPGDGIVCYPRTKDGTYRFGDLNRLRYSNGGADSLTFFNHTYMAVDFADFNADGRLDLVTTRNGRKTAEFYINTGTKDAGGLPQFTAAGTASVGGWQACRAVDLNNDDVVDVIVDGEYLRNDNPDGWPFKSATPVKLDAGQKPCFLDVDHDGRLDAVCLHGRESVQPDFYRIAWRRNLGGEPPVFDVEELLTDVDLPELSQASAWSQGTRSGLIVQHGAFQQLSIYELAAEGIQFRRIGQAKSISAVMSLSDQAWPCLCDWDADGDQDLLIGGGYGWPRIVINDGTRERPAFREPMRILAAGSPIRFVRNEILGQPHNWHDMGYPYPQFVDWDGDGLQDLVCPNETNRIFWYRNIGSRNVPRFGARRQVECDGFPDSPQLRKLSATRASDPASNNGVYPFEKERPFLWRTGAALADFNGDGQTDMITHDGHSRQATLFVQYRHTDGSLHLRKDQALQLDDGRPITDAIVSRKSHWTESFRAVDWNADGLHDVIYSVAGAHNGTKDDGSIYLLLNVGTETAPLFAEPETMRCFGEPIRITHHGPHPWPGDFDSNGTPDLITCVEWSVYPYYSHAALMMKQRPRYTLNLID